MHGTAALSTIAQWREIRRVYPIYAAIAKEFGYEDPPYASLDNLPGPSETLVIGAVQSWLAEMDERFEPHQFRSVLERPELARSEDILRGLIQRHLRKQNRSNADRDKLHYLLTQYASVCAPPRFRIQIAQIGELAEVLEPVLGQVTGRPEGSLQALAGLVPLMPRCSTVQALEASVVIPGRQIKAGLGELGETAAGLLVISHFNYSLRCTYSRLLKEELHACKAGLEKLEAQKVTTVDCTTLGLSAAEPVEILRDCLNELSQVAPADDAIRKARSEQVLALRSTIEAALKAAAISRPVADERIPAMEAYIQRLVNDLGEAKSELQSLRRVIEDVAAARQGERMPIPHPPNPPGRETSANPPAVAPPGPAPVETAPAASPPPSDFQPPPKAPPQRDFSTDVNRCREGLRRVLASNPGQTSRAVKVGAATVVLTPGEIETLHADSPVAALAHRGITARILLLNMLEKTKRGDPVEAAGVLDFARATLLELQQLLATGGAPEGGAVTAEQLRLVLQQAEEAFHHGNSS